MNYSPTANPAQVRLLPSRQRSLTVLLATLLWTLLLSFGWKGTYTELLLQTSTAAISALITFCLFEQWPRNLPQRLPRWVIQVVGVAISIPLSLLILSPALTEPGALPLWQDHSRHWSFLLIAVTGMLFGPWLAMSALLRQRDIAVREQAQLFERQRGALEHQALNARLRLLQSQVAPHFLFNTLANVQELVESSSPQAPALLNNLIAYLRAAVPKLESEQSTLEQELTLVQAYLGLMQMRMPDRLEFSINADDEVRSQSCLPMSLMSLVENAVRHGIDPSEEGGRIDIEIKLEQGLCIATVTDSGIGIQDNSNSLGTGLATLRERLQLTYGDSAGLRLIDQQPTGLCAELLFPAKEQI
ncbi:sensor histidine kinase [Microbulbifer sp. SSSA005]|uniref:sensor histidine kinase n=1 Tax=Microbulbifer sp. SSSA005 TaxID=3243378 RepID=UPI0040391CB7